MLLSDFKFAYALGPATFPSLAMAIQYIQVALLQLRIREQEIMCQTFLDATALYKLWRHAGRVSLAQESSPAESAWHKSMASSTTVMSSGSSSPLSSLLVLSFRSLSRSVWLALPPQV